MITCGEVWELTRSVQLIQISQDVHDKALSRPLGWGLLALKDKMFLTDANIMHMYLSGWGFPCWNTVFFVLEGLGEGYNSLVSE